MSYSLQAFNADGEFCKNAQLESNALWSFRLSNAMRRMCIQTLGSFVLVLSSVLIGSAYDGSSPMVSSFAVSACYFLVTQLFLGYNFNPVFTVVGGLVLATPCNIDTDGAVPQSSGRGGDVFYTFGPIGLFSVQLPRILFDLTFQIIGSVLAAALIWFPLMIGPINAMLRFDGSVRDDIATDANGAIKVFLYVLLFSILFAMVCYYTRYQAERTTCVSVQKTPTHVQSKVVCFAFFVFTSALAPMIGCGSLNILGSIGTAIVTLNAPTYFASIVTGQFVGFGVVALVCRFVVHRSAVCKCMRLKVEQQSM